MFRKFEKNQLECFKDNQLDLHKKILEICLILSQIHQYFGKKSKIDIGKEAVLTCEIYKSLPSTFSRNKHHKINAYHKLCFAQSPKARQTPNICYTQLQVQQAGERLHHIWNILIQSRFFCHKMVVASFLVQCYCVKIIYI